MLRAVRWAGWMVQHAPQLLRTVPRDPIGALLWMQEELVDRREHRGPACPYVADEEAEQKFHALMGAPWPCPACGEFWELWPRVMRPFETQGVAIGRGAFGGWGDGEPGLARAAWCAIRHTRPDTIVETGVARGFTSRIMLEALERNGKGHLWSVDLPPVQAPELHAQIGAAIEPRLRHHWTYIRGASTQRLPKLVAKLGVLDLFVHDSRHTERNLLFELNRVWPALTPGGFLLADDIDMNWGFQAFARSTPGQPVLHCYAEPLRADPKRFGAKGLFGIVQKAKPRLH